MTKYDENDEMNKEEIAFMSYYIGNKKTVWNVICSIKDENERMEMIEKALIIERRIERSKMDV